MRHRLLPSLLATATLVALVTSSSAAQLPGRVVEGRFSSKHGERTYRLYVPAKTLAAPRPLVVMLHGCTQDAADGALGTGLDARAERDGFLALYPEQSRSANPQRCWNWFDPANQGRAGGEPALLAGLVRDVLRQYKADPARVLVAGISAGGAMSAILGATYPELFAAVASHSGVAVGSAHSAQEAMSVMARGPEAGVLQAGARDAALPPLLVIQGDADRVVSPKNAESLAAQWAGWRGVREPASVDEVEQGGYHVRRAQWRRGSVPVVEQWSVRELGHAWSGGAKGGSFVDERGPSATDAMLDFFTRHARPRQGPPTR
jgi:poly(hydroxyalkanoate) depolymerase family esterase